MIRSDRVFIIVSRLLSMFFGLALVNIRRKLLGLYVWSNRHSPKSCPHFLIPCSSYLTLLLFSPKFSKSVCTSSRQKSLQNDLHSPCAWVGDFLFLQYIALHIRTSSCLCLEVSRCVCSSSSGADGGCKIAVRQLLHERCERVNERSGGGTSTGISV